jgi:hypothetical protein
MTNNLEAIIAFNQGQFGEYGLIDRSRYFLLIFISIRACKTYRYLFYLVNDSEDNKAVAYRKFSRRNKNKLENDNSSSMYFVEILINV